ncbi:hypothetical protein HDE_12450 [Halotydeus destructor]|nr:hypothetical protein HDE_12450 [Halotydeus destructor]
MYLQLKISNMVTLILVTFLLFVDIFALKLTNVHVPREATEGYTYWLNCSYDLERDQLYSIKWYKDFEEIYRFLPSSNPSKAKYDAPGLNIDLAKSNYGNISVTITDSRSQGEYRCEVSAEAPFQTVKESKTMEVRLSTQAPSIQTVKESETMKVYLKGDQPSSSLPSFHIASYYKLCIYSSIMFTMAFGSSYIYLTA